MHIVVGKLPADILEERAELAAVILFFGSFNIHEEDEGELGVVHGDTVQLHAGRLSPE